MTKNWEISYLLDFYGDVLTEKQRDVMEQYYNDDLSLAEIADNFGITRQGVRDAIKRGEATILELEDKVGFARRYRAYRRALNRWSSWPATSISTTATVTPCPRTIHRAADEMLRVINSAGRGVSNATAERKARRRAAEGAHG